MRRVRVEIKVDAVDAAPAWYLGSRNLPADCRHAAFSFLGADELAEMAVLNKGMRAAVCAFVSRCTTMTIRSLPLVCPCPTSSIFSPMLAWQRAGLYLFLSKSCCLRVISVNDSSAEGTEEERRALFASRSDKTHLCECTSQTHLCERTSRVVERIILANSNTFRRLCWLDGSLPVDTTSLVRALTSCPQLEFFNVAISRPPCRQSVLAHPDLVLHLLTQCPRLRSVDLTSLPSLGKANCSIFSTLRDLPLLRNLHLHDIDELQKMRFNVQSLRQSVLPTQLTSLSFGIRHSDITMDRFFSTQLGLLTSLKQLVVRGTGRGSTGPASVCFLANLRRFSFAGTASPLQPSMQDLRTQLEELGVERDRVWGLSRWERVALIRRLANERQLLDGPSDLQKHALEFGGGVPFCYGPQLRVFESSTCRLTFSTLAFLLSNCPLLTKISVRDLWQDGETLSALVQAISAGHGRQLRVAKFFSVVTETPFAVALPVVEAIIGAKWSNLQCLWLGLHEASAADPSVGQRLLASTLLGEQPSAGGRSRFNFAILPSP